MSQEKCEHSNKDADGYCNDCDSFQFTSPKELRAFIHSQLVETSASDNHHIDVVGTELLIRNKDNQNIEWSVIVTQEKKNG